MTVDVEMTIQKILAQRHKMLNVDNACTGYIRKNIGIEIKYDKQRSVGDVNDVCVTK